MPGNHHWYVNPANVIVGTNSPDALTSGGSDSAKISGRGGEDYIFSGPADDILSGGRGFDTFAFDVGDGFDIITDYQPGIDQFNLVNATRNIEIEDHTYGTLVTYGSGGFFLLGVDADDVNTYDFIV